MGKLSNQKSKRYWDDYKLKRRNGKTKVSKDKKRIVPSYRQTVFNSYKVVESRSIFRAS